MALKMSVKKRQNHLVTLATKAAIGTAALIIICKIYAWIQTDSISLQASLIDSILDLVASVLNFFVVRQALKPADKEHRFGHGKAEAIGGLAQATFIAGSAVWLCIEVVHRLIAPHPLQSAVVGTVIMVVASVLTFALVLFQRYVVRQTNSLAIKADSLHYQTDLLTNIAVLISLNISYIFGWTWLDAIAGAVIAAYILVTSYEIGMQSLNVLMDRELSDETREKIIQIAISHAQVLGVHELRTRSAGQLEFIQMHLDLNKDLSLFTAHQISDEVELAIRAAFPHSEVIIHQDPR